MSHLLEQDRTGLFNAVGSPYVAEQHGDSRSHYHRYSDEGGPGIGMASLWLTFYGVILSVAAFGKP